MRDYIYTKNNGQENKWINIKIIFFCLQSNKRNLLKTIIIHDKLL